MQRSSQMDFSAGRTWSSILRHKSNIKGGMFTIEAPPRTFDWKQGLAWFAACVTGLVRSLFHRVLRQGATTRLAGQGMTKRLFTRGTER